MMMMMMMRGRQRQALTGCSWRHCRARPERERSGDSPGGERPGPALLCLQSRSRGHGGVVSPGPCHRPGPRSVSPPGSCLSPSIPAVALGLGWGGAGPALVCVTKAPLPFTVSAQQYNILASRVAIARACDAALKETDVHIYIVIPVQEVK